MFIDLFQQKRGIEFLRIEESTTQEGWTVFVAKDASNREWPFALRLDPDDRIDEVSYQTPDLLGRLWEPTKVPT